MTNNIIGNNIRNWRTVKQIKQQTLANQLDITPSALSNIENGKTNLTISRLNDIAKQLNLELQQLLKDPFVNIP